MEIRGYTARLEAQARVIIALTLGVSDEQARWKPAPNEWSILEVVCHLYDEEREDFRARIRLMLEDPARNWPPIDPEGWAKSRRYNERNFTAAVAGFQVEREMSLDWLATLSTPNWDAAHRHPAGFDLRAGDLLAAWTAHDLLHIRQLADLHRRYITEQAAPYSTRYAGE